MAKGSDVKQFLTGYAIGSFLPFVPDVFNVEGLRSVTEFVPNLVADMLPMLNVGSPTALSVVLHGVIVGVIIMIAKK